MGDGGGGRSQVGLGGRYREMMSTKFFGGMECQRKDSIARTRECFGLICEFDKKVSFIQLLSLRSVCR